jgi:hypothetical protein
LEGAETLTHLRFSAKAGKRERRSRFLAHKNMKKVWKFLFNVSFEGKQTFFKNTSSFLYMSDQRSSEEAE